MLLLVVVLVLTSVNTYLAQNCIFLSDCAVANKYLERRKDDPETVKLLEKVHCGYEIRENSREAKVNCDQIPDLDKNCVYLDDCPAALNLIDKHQYERKTIELLRSIACGNSEQQDMVYCYKIKPSNNTIQKVDLLPSNETCGIQNTVSKITNGISTELDEFPWLALLKYKNSTNHIKFGCHGSLINEKYVLTAAHCLDVSPSKKQKLGEIHSVILGEYDIRNETDCLFPQFGEECNIPVQEISIESYHVHPNFGKKGTGSDIALIRLKTKAQYTDFVQPICLPLENFLLKNSQTLLVAGWGKTETKFWSEVKLKTTVFYINKEECGQYHTLPTDNTQLCAGSNNKSDTCKGDSGGPLMIIKNQGGDFKLYAVGIVSLGFQCGDRAAIYTNTSFFIDWILETMQP